MTVITGVRVLDIRFPTALRLDGSDAMNPDPDYSAAYCIIETDRPDLTGHGLTFTIRIRDSRLRVKITVDSATYTVLDGSPLRFRHLSVGADETLTLSAGQSSTQSWTAVEPLTPRPHQPTGRAPIGSPT